LMKMVKEAAGLEGESDEEDDDDVEIVCQCPTALRDVSLLPGHCRHLHLWRIALGGLMVMTCKLCKSLVLFPSHNCNLWRIALGGLMVMTCKLCKSLVLFPSLNCNRMHHSLRHARFMSACSTASGTRMRSPWPT
jgi:hypothetical protein